MSLISLDQTIYKKLNPNAYALEKRKLQIELLKYNINLELIVSDTYEDAFKEILKKESISIYWNKIYEPKYLKFDKKLSKILENKEIYHMFFLYYGLKSLFFH